MTMFSESVTCASPAIRIKISASNKVNLDDKWRDQFGESRDALSEPHYYYQHYGFDPRSCPEFLL